MPAVHTQKQTRNGRQFLLRLSWFYLLLRLWKQLTVYGTGFNTKDNDDGLPDTTDNTRQINVSFIVCSID